LFKYIYIDKTESFIDSKLVKVKRKPKFGVHKLRRAYTYISVERKACQTFDIMSNRLRILK